MEPRYIRGALYIIFHQGRHHHQNATTATKANDNVLVARSMRDL